MEVSLHWYYYNIIATIYSSLIYDLFELLFFDGAVGSALKFR